MTATTQPKEPDRLQRLEAIRGAATVYVLFHHYVHVILAPHYPHLQRFFRLGQFSLMVFFVLSGFVIYYSTFRAKPGQDGRPDFRAYFIRRFRRIYPPFLLVLLMTYLVQCLIEGGIADPRWGELAGNLVMLQDDNVHSTWFRPYHANASLWSLSYEWTFYMLFFPLLLVSLRPGQDPHGPETQRRQIALIAGVAITAFAIHQVFPNPITLYLLYMPIWWVGVEFGREYIRTGHVTARAHPLSIGLVALMGCLWVGPVYQFWLGGGELNLWRHPVFELRHFVTALIVFGLGLGWNAVGWRGFYPLLRPFERVAPISYGLYIVHKPWMSLAAHRAPLGNPWLEVLWVIPVVWGLSWFIERGIQPTLLRLFPAERKKVGA